ncbi:hypothetical protein DFR36_102124 [Melaminivora alkalimesophila]|uniref:Uncharacterized protein n=2 Tax=Melaminivora alkalimesophila TaxID=1165852 RepID=A0A317RDC4_9BURK|nr:hypothetical protein [Melaminivora alkalimesophila]PWW47750.1 hypothetical protein DFR36_102124 [Melaminivora alkalimesophila]
MTRSRAEGGDAPDWADAPQGWDWLAQDADGKWYWYRTEPQLFWAGGLWRSNSRNQQYAGQGAPSEGWADSLRVRPGGGSGG